MAAELLARFATSHSVQATGSPVGCRPCKDRNRISSDHLGCKSGLSRRGRNSSLVRARTNIKVSRVVIVGPSVRPRHLAGTRSGDMQAGPILLVP